MCAVGLRRGSGKGCTGEVSCSVCLINVGDIAAYIVGIAVICADLL